MTKVKSVMKKDVRVKEAKVKTVKGPVLEKKKKKKEFCPFEVDGFRVFPWKFDEESVHFMQLLYKEHVVRKTCNEKPLKKTLLVSEVPPCMDENMIKKMFSQFGSIKDAFLQDKATTGPPVRETSKCYPSVDSSLSTGYRVAYVVFEDPESVAVALKKTFSSPFILSTDEDVVFGLPNFVQDYNEKIVDEKELLEEAKKFLHEYENEEMIRREEEKRVANEPDEGGWITVGTRGTKKGGFSRSEAMEKKVGEAEKKKKSKKELVNFYTFQVRESKMKHIEDLQKRFEQDKRRLEMMKQNRRFKPY